MWIGMIIIFWLVTPNLFDLLKRRTAVKRSLLPLIFISVFLFACGSDQTERQVIFPTEVSASPTLPAAPVASAVPETPQSSRRVLSYDQLMGNFDPGSPVDESAFTMPEHAQPAIYKFEGRLELIGEDSVGDIFVHKGDPNVDPDVYHLPEFNFAFVQSGNYFIPEQRGLIITDHPNWNYLIEPGRAWQEVGDNDYSRVSFPFALSWKGSNAIFNGVMTFLFNQSGKLLLKRLHKDSPPNQSSSCPKIILRSMQPNSAAVSQKNT
jgi:hypothetical protein